MRSQAKAELVLNIACNTTYPGLSNLHNTLNWKKTKKEAFPDEVMLISHQKHRYNWANSNEIPSKTLLVRLKRPPDTSKRS